MHSRRWNRSTLLVDWLFFNSKQLRPAYLLSIITNNGGTEISFADIDIHYSGSIWPRNGGNVQQQRHKLFVTGTNNSLLYLLELPHLIDANYHSFLACRRQRMRFYFGVGILQNLQCWIHFGQWRLHKHCCLYVVPIAAAIVLPYHWSHFRLQPVQHMWGLHSNIGMWLVLSDRHVCARQLEWGHIRRLHGGGKWLGLVFMQFVTCHLFTKRLNDRNGTVMDSLDFFI